MATDTKMKNGIIKRGKKSWGIVLNLGYTTDPKTGKRQQKQRWVSFKGTSEQAKAKRAELVNALNKGTFVEPSRVTLREYFPAWLDKAIRPPARRQRTFDLYTMVVNIHLMPALGDIKLQKLTPGDLQRFYTEKAATVAPASLALFHGVMHSALATAVLEGLVVTNVASRVVSKPHARRQPEDVLSNCWSIEEAQNALAAAKTLGPQLAALVGLALDGGLRKAELCGAKWSDIDLDAGKLTVYRQLLSAGPEVTFGPPKSGKSRTIDLAPETVTLLREHKRTQAERKMRNRAVYRDLGLVFARESGYLKNGDNALGLPLRACTLGQVEFAKVIKAAKVRKITFHGLRHTCATLLFANGEAIPVVQQRLGHASPVITMSVYAHALPSMQQGAAHRLGKLLHG
jgi:integrase